MSKQFIISFQIGCRGFEPVQGSFTRSGAVQCRTLSNLLAMDRVVTVLDNLWRWIAEESERVSAVVFVNVTSVTDDVKTFLRR